MSADRPSKTHHEYQRQYLALRNARLPVALTLLLRVETPLEPEGASVPALVARPVQATGVRICDSRDLECLEIDVEDEDGRVWPSLVRLPCRPDDREPITVLEVAGAAPSPTATAVGT